MEWKRQRVLSSWSMIKKLTSLFFLLSISALLFTSTSTCTSDCSFPSSSAKADATNFQGEQRMENVMLFPFSLVRRYLSGPGSSPPRCTSKCGRCSPCKPVHVPVPPGTPVTAEYYPEAWRCKCGNRLYMP
ncbi:EPIDERMAL PATTERNING FACTOR-like protein 6 [Argentina anserina]|uniref:EPIDERMAL PATTERNING FACTOR-like protein 6 n=1 Tax=Argentina anserina TaxID=57926 RepID=UPI0021768D62|nr:EPIDERMAL PATTERNING FACTOR-like protein 6 [Potentilla anserina]